MVADKNTTLKLSKQTSPPGGVPYRNSFNNLRDEVEVEEQEESKVVDIPQPTRSCVLLRDSLCRYFTQGSKAKG